MKSGKHISLMVMVALFLTFGGVSKALTQTAEKGPIRIGLEYELTGVNAGLGKFMINGAKQLFEEKGLKVAGRKIELFIEDNGGSAASGLATTKRLVEYNKVHVITGIMLTPIAYAIRDYVHKNGVPTVTTGAGAEHTRKLFSPYLFRVCPSTYQQGYEPAKWFARHGTKKVIFMGADFAAPHESFAGWKKGFEEEGGSIVQELWPPWVCTDYGPYLSQVKAAEADAMVVAIYGESSLRVINQWAEYGLKKRIPIIGFTSSIDESLTLPAMGANAENLRSFYTSCAMSTNIPTNQRFVSEFKKRYKEIPEHHAYLAYIMAQATYEAMEAVKGNVEDKQKFLEALRKVNFVTPMGYKAYFDEKQGMAHDFYILQVKKADDGQYHLFEIDRIKDVKDPYREFP